MTMNRIVFAAAFAAGVLAVAWVGAGFLGTNGIALAMTAAIAAAYLLGAGELSRLRAATTSLDRALAEVPQPLSGVDGWLERVPAALRHPVRLRIEGERVALPGPALTPYLVGLLVMLGMLGTFLGMIVTFQGTVFALEGSADLQAIRSALAAPIRGLGLAFGTSVAGVAASAALGLMSAVSRRHRSEVGRRLDDRIATVFRPFSLVHQRQQTLKALQIQADALPDIVGRLDTMIEGLEHRSQRLDEQLLDRNERLHLDLRATYTGLAQAVGASLEDSLASGARMAGESIRPVVEAAMSGIEQQARLMLQRQTDATQAQLQAVTAEFGATARTVSDTWTAALQEHERTGARQTEGLERAADRFAETFEQRTAALVERIEALVRARVDAEAIWTTRQAERMDQLAALWRTEMGALRDDEAARGQAAAERMESLQTAATDRLDALHGLAGERLGALQTAADEQLSGLQTAATERLGELQSAVAAHLATLGAALEAPMTRLLDTASEAPRAAAEVIAQLRQEMSRLTERDRKAIEEHATLLQETGALLRTLQHASVEQRAAIDAMAASAATVLKQAGTRFSDALESQAGQATETATQITASAIELSSLGESFGHGVQRFSASNEKLLDGLHRIEGALARAIERSDEQLVYYVAQAREVIDLSIAAQQGIVEDLRQLHARPPTPSAEGV